MLKTWHWIDVQLQVNIFHLLLMIHVIMGPCSGKILASDMALKQRVMGQQKWQQTTQRWAEPMTATQKTTINCNAIVKYREWHSFLWNNNVKKTAGFEIQTRDKKYVTPL